MPRKLNPIEGEDLDIAAGRGAINRHGQLVITVDRANIPALSARSPTYSNRRRRGVTMRCSVATLLTLLALGSFASGGERFSPTSEPTIVRGELSELLIPLGTDRRVCIDAIYSNGTHGMDCRDHDWRMTNPDPSHPVASIDATGMVAALSVGKATITVTYLGRTLSALCTVAAPVPTKLNLGHSYPTIDVGSKESFRVTADLERRGWTEVMRGVNWTVTDVEPALQVAVIDQAGQVTGLHPGMAKIQATWMGQTASTVLSVVSPSKAAPAPVRISGLQPQTWRRLCLARLRSIWLPRLRALPKAEVKVRNIGDRHYGVITVAVRQGALRREISIRWNPEECDAGGPNSGWTPAGFDWRTPSTQLEIILGTAGYDCLEYIP